MKTKNFGKNTLCTHAGQLEDTKYGGAVSPLYMSTSYPFQDVEQKRYPRYFNTPNQQGLAEKIAALEHGEAGLIFGSGMAAITTALFAFLRSGDHVIMQNAIYGGTRNLINEEFEKFGIQYSYADAADISQFKKAIRHNTKVIYIETPSNPLLEITDLQAVVTLAKTHNLVTMIDNTFASPINQNPIDFGIDIVLHSATKYMSGHSDILAGAVVASKEHIERIFNTGKNFGGTLSDFTVWLLERSLKTMAIRVKRQNRNARKLAKWLSKHKDIAKVYYPGLKSHPGHAIAKKQMQGYGGMLSFELRESLDAKQFQDSLKLIKSSMSLAGVESTILSPHLTSHALLSEEERKEQGIVNGLLRFSVGIEESTDLKEDIEQALEIVKKLDDVLSS